MVTTIGKHRVRHGDVHNQAEIANLVGTDKADIFYSDPPWGTGNIKYWDTINQKMNGDAGSTGNFDVDAFLKTVLGYAKKYTDGFVVIEYGKQWNAKVKQFASEAGLIFCNEVETLYGSGQQNLPMDILVFHTSKAVNIDLSNTYHTKGYNTVSTLFTYLINQSERKSNIGMDLCCGMGYTAKACIQNKMRFIGNELNRARLDKTIKRLEKDVR